MEINKKRTKALYISTDGKVDKNNKTRYIIGTQEDFNFLLTGNKNKKCAKEILIKDFILLYNNNNESNLKNTFVSRYVDNTEVCGPVIILKKDKDLDPDTFRWVGERILKRCDWLGFQIT